MGQQEVLEQVDVERRREFMKALLADLYVLEKMLAAGQLESGITRIGAEQEMVLVDRNMLPAPVAAEVLKRMNDRRLTTEIAKFNVEANIPPLELKGDCLHQMETQLQEVVGLARTAANFAGAEILLTGILPTLRLSDVSLANMADVPRYHELNRALTKLRGSSFMIHIKGTDEIYLTCESMMSESCNTSYQLHYQVDPENFPHAYNTAQLIAGPLLAGSVNSPLLFGQRLWSETRVALFQHSVDERSAVQQERNKAPRVSFGDDWIKKSILEIFRNDIARFRVILTHTIDEDPSQVLARGEAPLLSALRLHNGTVWRWNRPCYGIINGKAHLRIENRVLPSGPTVLDEVANAAIFFGLMNSIPNEYPDFESHMNFDDAKDNFYAACRFGLKASFHWVDGSLYSARDLLLEKLIPMARAGLVKAGVDSADIERYTGIFEERVTSGQTGAQWAIRSFTAMGNKGTLEVRCRSLARGMLKGQNSQETVHKWPLAGLQEEASHSSYRTVQQFMSTNLFTIRPDDIVDLAASIMHWERISHLPVEDEEHRLVGLVSQRHLLLLLAQGSNLNRSQSVPVHVVMKTNPITVSPDTPTLEAVRILRENNIGCLPVVKDNKLVGLVTLYDLLAVSAQLLEEALRNEPE